MALPQCQVVRGERLAQGKASKFLFHPPTDIGTNVIQQMNVLVLWLEQ